MGEVDYLTTQKFLPAEVAGAAMLEESLLVDGGVSQGSVEVDMDTRKRMGSES